MGCNAAALNPPRVPPRPAAAHPLPAFRALYEARRAQQQERGDAAGRCCFGLCAPASGGVSGFSFFAFPPLSVLPLPSAPLAFPFPASPLGRSSLVLIRLFPPTVPCLSARPSSYYIYSLIYLIRSTPNSPHARSECVAEEVLFPTIEDFSSFPATYAEYLRGARAAEHVLLA
ncbi:hypothetical protein DFH07DRAFT_963041 [Mycena maculata]|uniref:Uncharacterized protein n=1 Tax=Mycena maculata TaxID=230809 RepID=A0AAD7N6A9_9AGAR|nr:hypothetical protein DFH07DRAFT_963041 [Mycena maculata]